MYSSHFCGFLTKETSRGGFFPLWFLTDSCPPWQGSMAEATQVEAPSYFSQQQTEKDKSEPSKACSQWSTSAIQTSPPISTAFRTTPSSGDCVHKMPSCGGKFQFWTMMTGEHWLIVFRFATKSECLLYIWGSCVWPGPVCSLVCPFTH